MTRDHRPHQERAAARLGRGDRRADRSPTRSTGATAPPRSTTRSASELVDAGTFERLSRRQAPELLPRAVGPGDVARVEDRTFICSEHEARRRPDQQLARPGRDARDARRAVRRAAMRGRTMYVVPFSMGPLGSPISHDRRPAHRLAVRRRQHADHDPHGPGRARRARRRRRLRPLPALGRRAARPTASEDVAVAVQRREVHRPLPRDARDLVLRLGLRRQRAARQEVLRAAHRLGDGARRGLAGRAHADPQAHLARGRGQVHHRRLPDAPAARPTSRC